MSNVKTLKELEIEKATLEKEVAAEKDKLKKLELQDKLFDLKILVLKAKKREGLAKKKAITAKQTKVNIAEKRKARVRGLICIALGVLAKNNLMAEFEQNHNTRKMAEQFATEKFGWKPEMK